ncbi:MAG TPA: hypothetical protein VMN43_08105 [Aestuariivirgaceae bacterium]|nr:hypothetical protein [Aestuariivirgaceae bacterium]
MARVDYPHGLDRAKAVVGTTPAGATTDTPAMQAIQSAIDSLFGSSDN